MSSAPITAAADGGFEPSFAGMMALLERLRGEGGCPWDRRQTSESLREMFLEEACELIEAIDAADAEGICEEAGDVLMHVGLQVLLGREEGRLSEREVFGGLIAKLVRRHPHVFGPRPGDLDAEGVLANWDEIKRAEGGRHGRESAMDGVPAALPALASAQAVQRKAARTGFDWEDADGVLDKVPEELGELRAARSDREREDEFGDLLFSMVNAARWMDIDAETALRRASRRFADRFRAMEQMAARDGSEFATLAAPDKEALWERAKSGRS